MQRGLGPFLEAPFPEGPGATAAKESVLSRRCWQCPGNVIVVPN